MSLITDLPAIFDQFSEARQKGFLTVMDLKEQNVPLVGNYCTFMPQEIAMAAGAVVVSLCSTSDETIEEAEKDLPRNLCPLIKSSYGFGKTDKCPYFYFSDLVVGETTCDGKKKMYEYMAEFKAVHVMQLPNSASDAASRARWKAEILRLQLLSQMVEEYQADGVIDVILQACHTYAVESLAIKRHLRQQHDLPYMAIETDYSTADLGQLSTRVAAFIEML